MSTVKDDFWHLDGRHRSSAPTANGRDVSRFESGVQAHADTCTKVPRPPAEGDQATDQHGTLYTVDRVRESRRFGTVWHVTTAEGVSTMLTSDNFTLTVVPK